MYDPNRIDKTTSDLLIYVLNSLSKENNEKTISDLTELLCYKKETAKATFDDICGLTWFFPGVQVIVLNNVTTGYVLDSTLELFHVLCESKTVVTEMLANRFDFILHHLVVGYTEKHKMAVLDIFCTMFKSMDGESEDLVSYSELLPLILRAIALNDNKVKVKASYVLYLMLSLSSTDNPSVSTNKEESYNKASQLHYKGLEYITQTMDRFNAMDIVIRPLVSYGIVTRNPLLLKNIFRIYLKLCEKKNVRSKIVEDRIPLEIYDVNIYPILSGDYELKELYKKIIIVFDKNQ